jgi:hypothetical protein
VPEQQHLFLLLNLLLQSHVVRLRILLPPQHLSQQKQQRVQH